MLLYLYPAGCLPTWPGINPSPNEGSFFDDDSIVYYVRESKRACRGVTSEKHGESSHIIYRVCFITLWIRQR